MANLDFNLLLTGDRRKADNFVDATAWCKAFGRTWTDIAKQSDFKKFAVACCEKKKVTKNHLIQSSPGRGSHTWVHPLIAIKLAENLSPEFEVAAKEVLQKLIESPEELAANILINSHNKDRVDRAKKRVLCSETNKQTATLAQASGLSIGKIHNDRYNGLYRKTAAQLRKDAGLKETETPLDVLSTRDLQLNGLANIFALESGDANTIFDAANNLRDAYTRTIGKPLAPIFEGKLLRPSQARAIAYAPEYQGELPL